MNNSCTKKLAVLVSVILAAAATTYSIQKTEAILGADVWRSGRAPIATSGDKNVYVTWWTNKSGDWEVIFKASTDGGKTFGSQINLSNSKGVVSNDAEIAAAGSNVYVTWWERNQTANEPVLRTSIDNGKTFGEKIMLSIK
jgi:hypothetical protein